MSTGHTVNQVPQTIGVPVDGREMTRSSGLDGPTIASLIGSRWRASESILLQMQCAVSVPVLSETVGHARMTIMRDKVGQPVAIEVCQSCPVRH